MEWLLNMQVFWGPSGLIFVGAIIVAIGAFWAEKQSAEFERALNDKNEEIISLQHKLIGHTTGKGSIPTVEFFQDKISVKHHSGEYPLYDVFVNVTEEWFPQENESLPPNYFYENKRIPETRKRNIVNWDTDRLLPGESSKSEISHSLNDILFPETNKSIYSVTISTRAGMYFLYHSERAYLLDDKKAWHNSSILLELKNKEDGNELVIVSESGSAKWEKIFTLDAGHRGVISFPSGHFVPVWPERINGLQRIDQEN